MACLRLLLCVFLALFSRVLCSTKSRHDNSPPDCPYHTKGRISKGVTKTFFIRIQPWFSSLNINLRQRDCLDNEVTGQRKQMSSRDFREGEWNEVQFSVNDQGYRVLVNGQEKLTDSKESPCYKVIDVDIDGNGAFWSVDCDPRSLEDTSTSPASTGVTNNTSVTISSITSTNKTTRNSPKSKTNLYVSIGSSLFVSIIVVILAACLMIYKGKKALSGSDIAQPTTMVSSQPAANRANDIRLAHHQSSVELNLLPPLPPAVCLHHAQSVNLATAQLSDTLPPHCNPLFHTLPQRREFMSGSGSHEQTSAEHLYEEIDESRIFSPLSHGGKLAPGGSHESINSFYAAF